MVAFATIATTNFEPWSTHFHVRITTSPSVFLATWPNHFSLASLIVSLMFATPAIHHIALISSFLIFSILFIPIIRLLLCFAGFEDRHVLSAHEARRQCYSVHGG